jgi:HEAT repeat protein
MQFTEEIEQVAKRADKRFRAAIRRDAQLLLSEGVRGLSDLLRLISEEGRAAESRAAACWFAGQLGNRRALNSLIAATRDGAVAREAILALGEIGDKRAVLRLTEVLQSSPRKADRAAAAHALGWLGSAQAVQPLIEMLRDTSISEDIRSETAEALANIGDRSATPALSEALASQSDRVRFWAAYALGELGDSRAIPELEVACEAEAGTLPDLGPVVVEMRIALRRLRAKGKGKARWKCRAKCALRGPPDPCTGFISGSGTGSTESAACKAAKKAAGPIPRGCTKGHCGCKCWKQ